jgi:hypothetical protein
MYWSLIDERAQHVQNVPESYQSRSGVPYQVASFDSKDHRIADISAKNAKMKVGYYLKKGGFPAKNMANSYPIAYEMRKEYWDTAPEDRQLTKQQQEYTHRG